MRASIAFAFSLATGGIDFVNCYVYDTVSRPALCFEAEQTRFGLHGVHGNLLVRNPGKVSVNLGVNSEDVDLTVAGVP
jgi:hypothetical protein